MVRSLPFALALAFLFVGLLMGCELVRTPEECEEDLQAMQAVVAEAVAAGLSCQSDSDCVMMDVSNACYGACPVAVSILSYEQIGREIRDAEQLYCRQYGEECGYAQPLCPELKTACVQGSCRMVDPMEGL